MGSWGTGISSNDTYADVYSLFFDLYNDGLEVVEISTKLISENQEILSDPEDCNNFWFALAKAQWECKLLNEDVYNRIKSIIETGADLEVWRQLEADEKDIKKRKAVLDKFLISLQTEKVKPKARKKKIIRQPVFEKGDCLTFKLANGNYGGAVILDAIKDTEHGFNLVAIVRINQLEKPDQKSFEETEILVLNSGSLNNKPAVKWYLPNRHKQVEHLIEKISTLDILIDYDVSKLMISYMADFDTWVINEANKQFDSEKTKPRAPKHQTIKALIKKKPKWGLF
ncbi:hypothetical protein [Roseivirga seohaensis]|uniref:hypothetical protein n=1 Tax=Roseivirga seohaensis TaxID=1914963 RepID=UPI003BAC0418